MTNVLLIRKCEVKFVSELKTGQTALPVTESDFSPRVGALSGDKLACVGESVGLRSN